MRSTKRAHETLQKTAGQDGNSGRCVNAALSSGAGALHALARTVVRDWNDVLCNRHPGPLEELRMATDCDATLPLGTLGVRRTDVPRRCGDSMPAQAWEDFYV